MKRFVSPGVWIEETRSERRLLARSGRSVFGVSGALPIPADRPHEAATFSSFSAFYQHFRGEEWKAASPLTQAVHGFYANGGRHCVVVPTDEVDEALDALAHEEDVTIVAAPGRIDAHAALATHAEQMGNRVVILDLPDNKVCEPPAVASSMAVCYHPWLRVTDHVTTEKTLISPSGHIAGAWAANDLARGVHNAPANIELKGIIGLSRAVSTAEQARLNPLGVNVIRDLPGRGPVIWGARTLAGPSSDYRFIQVRRLVNQIKDDVCHGTMDAVFEQQGRRLWTTIQRQISSYLAGLWRQGALAGTTEREAFFVRCDEETNPPHEVEAGRVHVWIGVAVVKPAEFVVFTFSQRTGHGHS